MKSLYNNNLYDLFECSFTLFSEAACRSEGVYMGLK